MGRGFGAFRRGLSVPSQETGWNPARQSSWRSATIRSASSTVERHEWYPYKKRVVAPNQTPQGVCEAHRSTSSRFRSTLHRETPRQPHSGETTRRLLWRSTLQRETHDGIDSGRHTLTRRRPTAPDRGSCRRRAARTRPDSCQAVATPRTAASDACLHRSRALTWRAAGLDVLGSCAPVLAGWGAPRTPYPTTCSSPATRE